MLDYDRLDVFWHSKTDYKAIDWIAKNYLGYSTVLMSNCFIDGTYGTLTNGKCTDIC